MELWIRKLNRVENMSLRDQEIFPSVVVVIDESQAPARMQEGHCAQPGSIRHIVERAIPVVSKEGILLKSEIADN